MLVGQVLMYYEFACSFELLESMVNWKIAATYKYLNLPVLEETGI